MIKRITTKLALCRNKGRQSYENIAMFLTIKENSNAIFYLHRDIRY